MNLDQVTIEIRPRSPWEAVDLGLLMARRWWWPLTRIWLLVTLPPFLLLSLLPLKWLWVPVVLIWWLKPLFERPLLYLLSHAVFGELPDTRSALRVFPGLASHQWILSLTWRRFSPSRSMDLPVVQLEGLSGFRRQDRLSLLHREGSSPVIWLTLIGMYLEIFVSLGIIMLLYALLPSEIDIDWWAMMTDASASPLLLEYLLNTASYLAMTLVAPFYVACGFSLYLNRRIKLEAWDIDIAFQRIANKRKPGAGTLTILALVTGLSLLTPEAAKAQASPFSSDEQALTYGAESYTRESAKAGIDTIVRGEDFLRTETRHQLGFKDSENKDKKENEDDAEFTLDWLYDWLEMLEGLSTLAKLMELLLWLSVLALVLLLVIKYRHWLAAYLPKRVELSETRRPVTLFGMDVTRESLPEDISATALALWQQGKTRTAVALLYRASLSRLLEAGLDIEDSHTEEECLLLAKAYTRRQPRVQGAMDYFSQLTRVWQHLAYGHHLPDTSLATRLCLEWNQAWQLDAEPDKESGHA